MRSTTWRGVEQHMQFREGDELLFDFSRRVPIFDERGNPVMKPDKDGKMKQAMEKKRFKAGKIESDGYVIMYSSLFCVFTPHPSFFPDVDHCPCLSVGLKVKNNS